MTRNRPRSAAVILTAATALGMSFIAAAPALAKTDQWALDYLQARQVWAISEGAGVTVAIVDSGAQPVPDLSGVLLPGADFSEGPTSIGDGQIDLNGHGTGTAVLIAGTGSELSGLAPGAKILPAKDSPGEGIDPSAASEAISFAIAQHAQVINISESMGTTSDPALAAAITAAENADIVVVAAAGNDAAQGVVYPAAYPGVVAVGAIDQSGILWPDSNTGPQVTLTAPGVNVDVENETAFTGPSSGTSISTAYVSATVALIRSLHPAWTADQVITDLISTAKPAPGQTPGQHSNSYGYGVVDPLAALQAPAPDVTTQPRSAATTDATKGSSSKSISKVALYLGIAGAVLAVALATFLLVRLRRRV